jgi:hypothetical protein
MMTPGSGTTGHVPSRTVELLLVEHDQTPSPGGLSLPERSALGRLDRAGQTAPPVTKALAQAK